MSKESMATIKAIAAWDNQRRHDTENRYLVNIPSGRSGLAYLGLKWNRVGFRGAKAIADTLMFEGGCSLTRLNLERNHIGDRGAVAIMDALSKHSPRREAENGNTGFLNSVLRIIQMSQDEVRVTWPLPWGFEPPLEAFMILCIFSSSIDNGATIPALLSTLLVFECLC